MSAFKKEFTSCPPLCDTDSSPANAEAASLYRDNMKEYIRRVKQTVEESWLDPTEDAGSSRSGQETSSATATTTETVPAS